jgi:DNA modification methylase
MEFLGLDWDKVLPPVSIWSACYQAMRPGAFLLAFGHTRLYHRLGYQLEDVGFEIKDCLCWGYATGNPRPLNFDRAIDKAAGLKVDQEEEVYDPVTKDAKVWKGWANNLKTAWEPIVMAQKPLKGKYIENVLKYNVGGLNIDECRIPYRDEKDKNTLESFRHFAGKNYGDEQYFSANIGSKKQCNVHPDGRWPANLVWLDPLFVEYDHIFMVPKPSRREKGDYNEHLTVKPIELMERLIRLATPRPSVVGEKVIVMDPFMGCYDDFTEVLTKEGWKFFADVTFNDAFASLSDDGQITYDSSIMIHEYEYEGKLVSIKSRSTDLLVTPNHNMYLLSHRDFLAKRKPKFYRADSLVQHCYRIPCGGKYNPGPYRVPIFSRRTQEEVMFLLGLYLSEGYLQGNRLIICQKQGDKWDTMFARLLPFNVKRLDDRKMYINITTEQRMFIEENCGKGATAKFISEKILHTQESRSLFDGMMLGDGHVHSRTGQYSYYTSSRQLANGFQILALHVGFDSTLGNKGVRTSSIDGRKISATTDGLVVTVRKSANKKVLQSHISSQIYTKKVYCVTVPQHTLYVRRNGKTSWCGNSGSTGVAAHNLKRKFIGYENDAESFVIAKRRLKERTRDYPDLFAT